MSASFVELNDPRSRPFHFGLLELVVLVATVLVFAQAVAAYRRGDRRPLFQWLVITSYGVMMELVAFNFLHNYAHGTFTVMLYRGQLPLYVTGLYGSFMVSGLRIAERLRAPALVEALLAGFAMMLIDVPFDVAGVSLGWWKWLDTDPNLAFRWLGVPVTSYEWYLIFGAVAALLCRIVWPRIERRSLPVVALVSLACGFGVMFFGVLGFLPFHAFKALGVSDGAIVAAHIAACSVLALLVRGERASLSRAIVGAVVILATFFGVVLVWAAARGNLEDAPARLTAAFAAMAGVSILTVVAPLRRAPRASAPASQEPSPVSIR